MRLAAADSTQYDRDHADYVTNGTNDRTIVQRAFSAENEKLVVAKGTYYVSQGPNGVDTNPYIYPARGLVVQGEGATFIADTGICRIMVKQPNVVLTGLNLQGYVHIQNYESNQIFRDLTLSNKLPGQRWLDWRSRGGCTGHIQNWVSPGKTMSGIIIQNVTLEDSFHHGIGFHINGGDEGATFKDIVVDTVVMHSPGSGLVEEGKEDWSCGLDVDTGDINGMMVRNTTIEDSWQSACHTDGSWEGHSQSVKNLVFENVTCIGAGKRAGKIPKEMYEAGFYLQDALLRGCRTKDCRVGYLIGNENTGGLTMIDCEDEGSDYGMAVEYGGHKANVSGLTLKNNKIRSLIVLGQNVNYTNVRIEGYKGTYRPVLLGRMSKLIFCDSPYHQKDYQRYWDMTYTVSGRFDILSEYADRDKLAEVWKGSTMNWDGFTMTKIPTAPTNDTTVPPVVIPPDEGDMGTFLIGPYFTVLAEVETAGRSIPIQEVPEELRKYFKVGRRYVPKGV